MCTVYFHPSVYANVHVNVAGNTRKEKEMTGRHGTTPNYEFQSLFRAMGQKERKNKCKEIPCKLHHAAGTVIFCFLRESISQQTLLVNKWLVFLILLADGICKSNISVTRAV